MCVFMLTSSRALAVTVKAGIAMSAAIFHKASSRRAETRASKAGNTARGVTTPTDARYDWYVSSSPHSYS